jgi:hypothetical protein
VFEFCSGLVDLVVCVGHHGGGGHRLTLVGERFVGRLAEDVAEVGDSGVDFGDRRCGDGMERGMWGTPTGFGSFDGIDRRAASWSEELPNWYRSNGHRAPARQVCAPVVAACAEEQIVVGRSGEGSLGDTRAGRAGNLGAVDERGLEPDEFCRRP